MVCRSWLFERLGCRLGLIASGVFDQVSITADGGFGLQVAMASIDAQAQGEAEERDRQRESEERLLAMASDEFFECSEPKVLPVFREHIKPFSVKISQMGGLASGMFANKKKAKARGLIGMASGMSAKAGVEAEAPGESMQTCKAPASTIKTAQEDKKESTVIETKVSEQDALPSSARKRGMPERYDATHQPAQATQRIPTAQHVQAAEVRLGAACLTLLQQSTRLTPRRGIVD